MGSGSEKSESPTSVKTEWQKPTVRQLRAGAAEAGAGTVDDGDPGAADKDS